MKTKTSCVISSIAAVVLILSGAIGFADSTAAPTKPTPHKWAQRHPRQKEVLTRTVKEKRRIEADYKKGKITKEQRDQMLSQVKDVRQEDKADSKANAGYITKDQQKVMNKQENAVNQELRQDVKQDAGTTTGSQDTTTAPK